MIYDKTFVRSIFIFLLDDMIIDDALIWMILRNILLN